jgi:spermidine synthase
MASAGRPGSAEERAPSPATSPRHLELFGVVFVTGAAVMALEILGTRVIGPVFGVNLFVWSALLSVTLAALAVGYYAGGVVVDRRPSARLPGFVVLASGVAVSAVPLLRAPVLRIADSMGPRGGPLAAALVLFAPSLALLGMVGPVAVRLMTDSTRAAGHRVGATYAISTAGGLLSTLLTGFVLVPAFDTLTILFGIALTLSLLGAALVAARGRRAAAIVLLVPLLGRTVADPPLPRGIIVRDRAQSLYGLVEVIDDENRRVRLLRADHSIIGAQFLEDHTPAFSFIHLLEVVRFARPDARQLLQVGLGTGAVGAAFGPRGMTVDAVEIDPAVVRFAERYFGFHATGDVHAEDARTFLFRTDRRYDVIVHDTFTGGTTPEHLLSREVVQRVHDILRPRGVLVLNFVGYMSGRRAQATHAVARTLRDVFPVVRAFHDGPPEAEPDAPGNVVFFASDVPVAFDVPAVETFESPACERVARSFQGWEILQSVPDGPIIRDDQNPLATLELHVAAEHFDAMHKLLPLDVWLN